MTPQRSGGAASLDVRDISSTSAASFSDLGLGQNLVRVLQERGASVPRAIQAATIPEILTGAHVLGRAATGTGKTIAFGAALVERLLALRLQGDIEFGASARRKPPRGTRDSRTPKRHSSPSPRDGTGRARPRSPSALILAPTRELALQIDETVRALARSVGGYTGQFVGGMPYEPQLHAIERGVDIAIGTPGRILELVERRDLDLRAVRIVVVDEADHMSELGFLGDVQHLLRTTKRDAQRLLFSATLDDEILELAQEFLPGAPLLDAGEARGRPIRYEVRVIRPEHRVSEVIDLVRAEQRSLVFCRTRAETQNMSEQIARAGISSLPLHGDLSQERRLLNLERFALGKTRVLVATDVAARGLHIAQVDLVVQADRPSDAKVLIHRAGRSGRGEYPGRSVLLVSEDRRGGIERLLAEAEIDAVWVHSEGGSARRA